MICLLCFFYSKSTQTRFFSFFHFFMLILILRLWHCALRLVDVLLMTEYAFILLTQYHI